MSKSVHLRLEDVRALLQLVGECRDLGDDPLAWREHFCHRLAQLTGAGLVDLGDAVRSGGRLRLLHLCAWGWHSGFDPTAPGQTLAEHDTDLKFPPLFRAYFDLSSGEFGTRVSRTDEDREREWDLSSYRELVQTPVGCGHTLLCFLTLPGGRGEVCSLVLNRWRTEARDFTARHRMLMAEAHAAVVPLVGGPLAGFDEPSPADLPPRVRQVLRCLLEGDSDKQAAARLGISRFTVNEYTKEVYRHFRVQGRPELLARWVHRGWSKGFAW